jgi:hypothetical protein
VTLYKLIALTLMVVIPFTSLRVICVGNRAVAVAGTSQAHTQAAETGDCDDICLRPRKPAPKPDCLVLTGPCLLLLAGIISVTTADQPLPSPQSVTTPLLFPAHESYATPSLAPLSPPPKSAFLASLDS